MDTRIKTLSSFSLLAVALSTFGCGYTQQSKFQMSFLPSAPHVPSPVADIAPPPVASPNPFLQQMPALLLSASVPPRRKTHADALVQNADQAFSRGRRAYQNNDIN